MAIIRKRAKRVVVTAVQTLAPATPNQQAMTHREFFVIDAGDIVDAVRDLFAAKRGIEPDAVQITTSAERLSYRTPRATRKDGTAIGRDEAKAVAYARWLAERDGIRIGPAWDVQIVWDSVAVGGKPQKRIRAVHFGAKCRKLADFGRKRHFVDAFEVKAEIQIPHWDWIPTMTEETVPEESGAAVITIRPLPRFMETTSTRAFYAAIPERAFGLSRKVAA